MTTALKAHIAGLLVVITNLIVNVTSTPSAWPQTTHQWVVLILTSLGTWVTVYVLPNLTHDANVAATQSVKLRSTTNTGVAP